MQIMEGGYQNRSIGGRKLVNGAFTLEYPQSCREDNYPHLLFFTVCQQTESGHNVRV